ncbi:MAG: hypothetical protein AAGA10_30305 [Bacteroidota bacterium]
MKTCAHIQFHSLSLYALLLIVSIPTVVFSQEGQHIKGRILEGEEGNPIAYATIQVCSEAYGALSNELGEFDLYLPARFSGDSLCISSIGYQDLRVSISSLASGQVLTLSLEPSPFFVDSVNIAEKQGKLPSAKNLVRRALRRILLNYPQEAFVLTGYYRDYVRQDTGYINLFEAALSLWDPGFRQKVIEKGQGKILQTRYRESLQVDTLVAGAYRKNFKAIPSFDMPAYGGNEFSILQAHDPIRNHKVQSFSFVYRITKNFIPNHLFELDSILIQGEVPIYQISFVLNADRVRLFTSLPKAQKAKLVKGNIWIRSDTYGIVKFEYSNFFEKEPEKKRYEIAIEYQELQEKLYLKYISMNNYFEMNDSTMAPFEVSGVRIINGKDQIVLRFNRIPDPDPLANPYLFKLNYAKQEFEVTKSEPIEPNSVILTVPRIEKALLADSLVEGSSVQKEELERLLFSDVLRFNIHPSVCDTHGISIGGYPKKGMYQFREWFINEIDSQPATAPIDKMVKLKPLYLQAKEDDPSFWDSFTVMLNAPLKRE